MLYWTQDVFQQLCQGEVNGTVYCVYKVYYKWRLWRARPTINGCELFDITAEAINEPNATLLEGSYCNNVGDTFYDPVCAGECDDFAGYLADPVMDCDP